MKIFTNPFINILLVGCILLKLKISEIIGLTRQTTTIPNLDLMKQ